MSYERYHKYGFTYFPPEQTQRELVQRLRSASRPAARTLAHITTNRLVESTTSTDDPEQQSLGVTLSDGQQTTHAFHVTRHHAVSLTIADIGLFRNPNHVANDKRFHPKFNQLCHEITSLGDQTLKILGLTRPLPYAQAMAKAKNAYGDQVLPTARIGLVQFTNRCGLPRTQNAHPEAFINIGNQEQVWTIGGINPKRRTTVIQEVGGIIVRESRLGRTSCPNPTWEATAQSAAELLLVATNVGQEFDQRFPPPPTA